MWKDWAYLLLCERKPVYTRSCFSFAEQVVQQLGRRFFGFLCKKHSVKRAAGDLLMVNRSLCKVSDPKQLSFNL